MVVEEPLIDRQDYDRVVEQLLGQLNMGWSFDELFNSIFDQMRGIVPYNRKDEVDRWDLMLLGELSDQLATALDNASAYGQIARLKAQLEEQNIYLRDEIRTTHDFGNIVGESRAMQEVRHAIGQVAKTDSTVQESSTMKWDRLPAYPTII